MLPVHRTDPTKLDQNIGITMHQWATDLFPICRSLTGPGVRETLAYLQQLLPELTVHAVPTGYQAFDWSVPNEWTMRDGYIEDESGQRIVDFKQHNLHVVGYSEPVDRWIELEELQQHLHSRPEQPDAIPYVTTYYERNWGFCLSDKQRQTLKPGRYHVVIDADLQPGVLNYGELILPGETNQEVLLSTYICHPSMANNELSGPVVTTALIQWLKTLLQRRYTYRVVFIPETIGSIVYLSKHLEHLKKHVIAGYNITCVGDSYGYSFIPTPTENTLSDLAALHTLKQIAPNFTRHSWLADRVSDERQYCAPGVDLPIACVMRTRAGIFPEYHSSLDDLKLVTPFGLEGGFNALQQCIDIIEKDCILQTITPCEPQLGKHGLYPAKRTTEEWIEIKIITDIIALSDGNTSLLKIANELNQPFHKIFTIASMLLEKDLLKITNKKPEKDY